MSRRSRLCQACQRPFTPVLAVHGPVRQRIVDLVANRPDGITRAEIISTVYADDANGGPDNENVVSVLIKHANAELAVQGFRIEPAWRGPGARYRLIAIKPGTAEHQKKEKCDGR
jgi:hypothetical protein